MLCNVMLRYVMLCMYVCVCVRKSTSSKFAPSCCSLRWELPLFPAPGLEESPLGSWIWARQQLQGSTIRWVSGTMCQHCGLVLRDVSWAQFGPTLWGFIGVLNSTDHSCMCKVIDTDTAWVLAAKVVSWKLSQLSLLRYKTQEDATSGFLQRSWRTRNIPERWRCGCLSLRSVTMHSLAFWRSLLDHAYMS